jgi:signal transduction histidine kinase
MYMEKSETIDEVDIRPPVMRDAGSVAAAMIEELTAALAGRDRFISHIGHELRNSIAPMLLLADQFTLLASDPRVHANVATRVAMLTRNLNRFISTIDRVAEVTDLRRGKLQLLPESADLGVVVGEVCREASAEAAAAGAELVLEAGEPVVGRWDRDRLKRIASNLVSNAIRYGGGGRVEISIRSAGGDGELVVRDHGPGLAAAALPRLFDCFDYNNGQRTGGFGVGLWVVKTLCTAMRGTVTACNASGGGARFCVVLPRG